MKMNAWYSDIMIWVLGNCLLVQLFKAHAAYLSFWIDHSAYSAFRKLESLLQQARIPGYSW